MNKIINCKYVNARTVLSNSKVTKSQIAIKQYTQTTELRRILDVAAKDLNITHLNDWYKLPTKGYSKLLEGSSDQSFEKDFNASPFQLLSSAYPEHDWLPWKFERCPHGFWNDTKNVRKFMDWAATQLDVKEMSDWYNISTTDIKKIGGGYLLGIKPYIELLADAYPEYNWMPWKFEQSTKHYWSDIKNVRKFMDWAGNQLNVKEMSDWYNISTTDLNKVGGTYLLQTKSSYVDLLTETYPEYEWLPWKFLQCPKGFWSDAKNIRKYLDWVGKELNIKEMSDWYNVSTTDLKKFRGGYLLGVKPSFIDIFTEAYPEYDWEPWRFERTSRGYWNDIKNVRKFMIWAGNELGVKEMSDWYNISGNEIKKIGGSFLSESKSSYFAILTEVFPEYDWMPWKFEQCPHGFWNEIKNVRKFMDWAGKELGVKEMSDWYSVSYMDITRLGGDYLLRKKKASFIDLLTEVYPEYEWLPWRFDSFSAKTLVTNSNRRQQCVKWIANQLNIKEMNDWYKIKAEQIIDLKSGILLLESGSLPKLLSQVYPEFNFDESQFEQKSDIWTDSSLAEYFVEWLKTQSDKDISTICQYVKEISPKINKEEILTRALQIAFPNKFKKAASQNTKKSQYMLKESIQNIFYRDENVLILEEYKHPDVVNLEFDYFLPSHNLAFEYQGQQHYRSMIMHNRKEAIENVRERDRNKIDSCKQLGITLIEVPYWWDRKISSLATTIYNVRPDLFTENPQGIPIPLNPPQKDSVDAQKTNASKQVLMTATEWDYDTMEPKGWYMTEKYDGIRFYWDGKQCYSRQGNKINIPASLASQLPPVALDGELWTQYGLHQDAVTLMHTNKEEKWNKAVLWIFDAPHLEKPLEERIEFLQQLTLPSFAKVVEFVKCEGKEHLKQFNDAILAKGGEGVMLREPGSMYKPKRSTGLRKYKPYFDTEVKVLKNQYPQGFTCEQLNGRIVFVNTENSEQAKAVKKGDVITVKHNGVNVHGTLLYPQFFRERLDVSWNDLLNKAV